MFIFHKLLLSVFSILITLILIEIILKFFPVNDVTRKIELKNNDSPFQVSTIPNSILKHSKEWDFKNSRLRRSNNYGFFSDFDYESNFEGVVFVGDSMVEALQVNFEDTVHQVLSKLTGQKVYNVSIGGAPLSQYEAWVDQICKDFKPTKLVILIMANDFFQSFRSFKIRNGFFHYDDMDNNKLKASEYEISLLKKFANNSSLVKYLYFNLNIGSKIRGLIHPGPLRSNDYYKDPKAINYSKNSIEIFLKNMENKCVDPSDVIFVLDGKRGGKNSVYENAQIDELFMMDYFKESTKNNYHYKILDMAPIMQKDYNQNRVKFEFVYDGHWNSNGHKLTAKSIYNIFFKEKL